MKRPQSRFALTIGIFGLLAPIAILWIRNAFFSRFYLENRVLHAAIESLGASLAILIGLGFYFIYTNGRWATRLLWAASALISMGILTLIQSVTGKSDNLLVWQEAQTNLLGGMFAMGVCIPPQKLRSKAAGRIILTFAIVVAVSLGLLFVFEPQMAPTLLDGREFNGTCMWLNILGSILFLPPAFLMLRDFHRHRHVESILLGSLFLLCGVSGIFPRSYFIWGFIWWAWHFVQLLALLSAAGLLLHLYLKLEKELVASEERLRLKTDALARSNQELLQFATIASHDLREPTRTIASYLSLLQARHKQQLDAEAQEFLFFAIGAAHRMRNLIDDLLNYARVDSKSRPYETVDLNELTRDVIRMMDEPIRTSKAEIEVQALPTVYGERTQLFQLMQNLIENAIKYRRPEIPPKIKIAATQDGKWWEISVSDNGLGIEKKYTERIFEMLQRLHSASEIEGTGIGLALCKKIVERHGGKISVLSQPGEGSTFHFSLPKSEGPLVAAS